MKSSDYIENLVCIVEVVKEYGLDEVIDAGIEIKAINSKEEGIDDMNKFMNDLSNFDMFEHCIVLRNALNTYLVSKTA